MPKNKIRALVGVKSSDGHDAGINIILDVFKRTGIEVIYGGYDLTVRRVVAAAMQELPQVIGISSYNGGHTQFFTRVRDELQRRNYPHIHLIGGGGSTITPEDTTRLEAETGIDKIFGPGAGNSAANFVLNQYDFSTVPKNPENLTEGVRSGDQLSISGLISLAEEKARLDTVLDNLKAGLSLEEIRLGKTTDALNGIIEGDGRTYGAVAEISKEYGCVLETLFSSEAQHAHDVFTWGITGRGGAGKSTLVDELVFRFFKDSRTVSRKLAIVSVDPSSSESGGALLADRVAYAYATSQEWVDPNRIYIRSVASRGQKDGTARALPDILRILKVAGYDVIVETYGTSQADTGVVSLVDQAIFVTTPDLGGDMQVGKEAMLDVKGLLVVLNKSDLAQAGSARGALAAKVPMETLFVTIANQHDDTGVNSLYSQLTKRYGGP